MDTPFLPPMTPDARTTTGRVTRGVCRMLTELGYGALTEFRLTSGRRVDIMGLNDAGEFVVVEIKSTVADYRGDRKWPEYLPFCEQFYFAVPAGFPTSVVPDQCGLIVADGFSAVIRRAAPARHFSGARKRRQLLRFALTASTRLQRAYDPPL